LSIASRIPNLGKRRIWVVSFTT